MTERPPGYLIYEIDLTLANYDGAYPRSEMVKARKRLHEDLHLNVATSRLEMAVKRKCGILTKDLCEYKLEGRKPCAEFNESLEFVTNRFDVDDEEQRSSLVEEALTLPNDEHILVI